MQHDNNSEVQSTLLMAGGVALLAMGAGMLMTNPALRRVVLAGLSPLLPQLQGQADGQLGNTLLADVERYVKLKSM
jgi:hypothetical protein